MSLSLFPILQTPKSLSFYREANGTIRTGEKISRHKEKKVHLQLRCLTISDFLRKQGGTLGKEEGK